jgi:hypothetical protein
MGKVFIAWGKKPSIRKLTIAEKQALKSLLNKKAAGNNGFDVTLTPAQYHWLKDNLGNAVMELISRQDSGAYWVAIGTDIRAATTARAEALR